MAGWSLTGRWGAEVDAIGEEFGSGVLFDDRITDEPIDDIAEDLRFREESTRVSGLLRFILRDPSNELFRLAARIKSSSARTKVELTTDLQKTTSVGRFELLEVFEAQGGEDDPGGGVVNWATATWQSPMTWRQDHLRLALRHEVSRAGTDSLAEILDYAVFRPSLRWTRSSDWIRTTLETGSRHKRGGASRARDHDGLFAEIRGEHSWGSRGRGEVEARIENRSYAEADSITPSYQELSLRSSTAWPLSPVHTVRANLDFEVTEYAIDSSLLRDHNTVDLELGFEWRFRGVPAPGSTAEAGSSALAALGDILSTLDTITGDPDPDPEPDERVHDPDGSTSAATVYDAEPSLWTLRCRSRASRRQNQVGNSGEYGEALLAVSLSRESIVSGWWDFEIETGLRDYAASDESNGLIFEGINFSLTTTDYRFLRSSILAEFPLPSEFEIDVFGQFDREWHSEEANDLQLWILTASVTRHF